VKSILGNHPENPRVDLGDKILGHVGGKDDSARDNGSSNAADGYGVFASRDAADHRTDSGCFSRSSSGRAQFPCAA